MTHSEIIERFNGSKCPSCGRALLISEYDNGIYQVICFDDLDCCVSGPIRKTEAGAIRAWRQMFLD
jgi:ssDNA-binding Zn-finger/Zn-ribbon topoisomerase 1